MVGKEPEDVSELSSLAEPLALVDVLLASEKKEKKITRNSAFGVSIFNNFLMIAITTHCPIFT